MSRRVLLAALLVLAVAAVATGLALRGGSSGPKPSARARSTPSASPSSAASPSAGTSASAVPTAVPRFSHVVVVALENSPASETFESAPKLKQLRELGLYVPQLFGEGHSSLGNYRAMFGAVEPSEATKANCRDRPYRDCLLPPSVPSLGTLMDEAGLRWRVYSEGMAGAGGACLHNEDLSKPDKYRGEQNGYAARHNPAVWFASVLEHGGNLDYCKAHSVDLAELWKDAATSSTMPAWAFVEPDNCHNGHDKDGCGPPEGDAAPKGIAAIEQWLPPFVDRITSAPAWDDHSLLIVTFDESVEGDTAGCEPCGDRSAGGRIGTLLISKLLTPGTTTDWESDHYGLLRTLEVGWRLPTLKSRAATAAAADKVHDGDPGVTPLTGVWR